MLSIRRRTKVGMATARTKRHSKDSSAAVCTLVGWGKEKTTGSFLVWCACTKSGMRVYAVRAQHRDASQRESYRKTKGGYPPAR